MCFLPRLVCIEFQRQAKIISSLKSQHQYQKMDPASIAEKWYQAWNEHSIEKLSEIYDDHAKHYSCRVKVWDPLSEGWIHGKERLRLYWELSFEKFPQLNFEKGQVVTVGADRVVIEYSRILPGEVGNLVAEVLEIKDGKIIESRVYHG